MQNLFDLQQEVVIVTGGMGMLGQQYVHALLEYNARVAILDKVCSYSHLNSSIRKLANKNNLLLVEANVCSSSALKTALEQVEHNLGCPYGLINNAALDSPPDSSAQVNGPFETYPEKCFDQTMQVNVKGVFLACQVFGSRMAENGKGSIINISSIYGALSPNQSLYDYRRQAGEQFYKPISYSVSKSALFNLTRYLATYWAKQGVRVNTLSLGGVYNNQDEVFLDNYSKFVPIGRLAKKTEYNSAVIMLLAKSSSYMTGSTITVDGGWSAW